MFSRLGRQLRRATLLAAVLLALAGPEDGLASYMAVTDEQAFHSADIVAGGMFVERSAPKSIAFMVDGKRKEAVVRDYTFRASEVYKGKISLTGDTVTVRCLDPTSPLQVAAEQFHPELNREMVVLICPSMFTERGEQGVYMFLGGPAGVYGINESLVENVRWSEPKPAGDFISQLTAWSNRVPAHPRTSSGDNALLTLLFWPAITLSLILAGAGIVWRRPVLLITGAVLSLPFSYYLFMTPRFHLIGPLLPLCLLGGALAVHRRRPWPAWLLLAAVAGFFGWLGALVLGQ
ncbi:MAG: hypothetical protein QME76_09950 [Bacillota bacterium]|nr:hypothetical protein [Bacillota bacterium]